MGLIEERQAEAAENDRVILAALGAAGDTPVRVGDLAEGTGIAPRTLSGRLGSLRERGLITRHGERGPVALTAAGRVEAGANLPGVDVGPALDTALGLLPSEAHRAMARLLLSAVVARHHLTGAFPYGWAGFIALGGTAEGKTLLGRIVCRVFGLPDRKAVKLVQQETPGSLFARRARAEGGAWTVERSALLDLPFVCLDEWDKASADKQAAALALLQGDAEADIEGATLTVRPVAYLLLNTGPAGLAALPDAYVRRCVVLDTGAIVALLDDADEAARAILAPGVLPRLDLDALTSPAVHLPDHDRAWLRDMLKRSLTREGWKLTDAEALSRLALGRAAMTAAPGPDDQHAEPDTGQGTEAGTDPTCGLTGATVATCYDYLTVASTTGHTRPGWAEPFRDYLTAAHQRGRVLLPDPAQLDADEARRRRAALDQQAAATAVSVELVAERAALAARLREAADHLDGRKLRAAHCAPFRTQARGVREALRELAERVTHSRSRDALDGLAHLATEWTAKASDLHARIEQAARDNRDQQHARTDAEAARKTHVRAIREHLAEVEGDARTLERLWNRTTGNPLPVLAAVRLGGVPLLTFTPDPTPSRRLRTALDLAEVASTAVAAYTGAYRTAEPRRGRPGTWHVTGTALSYPGHADQCDALATWGPQTRAALAPALAALHRAEDELNAQLGRPTCRERPETADFTPAW